METFSENWYKVGYTMVNRIAILLTMGIHFGKIGTRDGYVSEASMRRPRPKSGQVPPPKYGVVVFQNTG